MTAALEHVMPAALSIANQGVRYAANTRVRMGHRSYLRLSQRPVKAGAQVCSVYQWQQQGIQKRPSLVQTEESVKGGGGSYYIP
jgi:hypothetical protein